MTVVYQQYIVIVVIAALLVSVLFFRNSIRYYRWVRKYWFYRRSLASYISLFLSIAGLLVLLVSVLDVKGKPEKQPLEIPDQKTIIMIDCSASMLVEDVKPSRFSKAILIARDFVKSAFGHQISLVLFSDYQRQIVPFTDDVNFLDTKLAALERLNITRGGSNVSQAIVEAIGYFKTDQAVKEPSGNLLIFTDAEELGEGITVSIPENINVGVVGVGTNYGGPIPLRTKRGKFKKYKKHRGERVVSRLDEEFLKKLGKKIKSYKYWVALSYSIPTAEVVTFFHNTHEKKIQKGVIYHSKSYSREMALSGIIVLILGLLFRFFKPLVMPLALCMLILPFAADAGFDKEEMSQHFKSGVLIRNHKLKLAEVFLKEGKKNKSYVLYKELIRNPETEDNITLFNYATACLQNGKVEEGLDLFLIIKSRIGDSIADDDLAMLEKVRENIFLALNQQNKGKNKKKDKEKKEKKKDKKKQQKKKQKQEKKEKKKKKEKEDSSKSKPKPKKPQKSPKPKSLAAKEKQLRKQRKLQKVPQIFDQLMKEDKNVQRKQMETSKSQRRSSHDQKDW